jgi:hypothetical protein
MYVNITNDNGTNRPQGSLMICEPVQELYLPTYGDDLRLVGNLLWGGGAE